MSGVQRCRAWLAKTVPTLPDDPSHPAQVALGTYALALSLSFGPALIPFVASIASVKKSPKTGLEAFKKVVRKELGHDGFAFSMTTCVAGAAALRHLWNSALLPAEDDDQAQGGRNQTAEQNGNVGFSERLVDWIRSLDLLPAQITFISNLISSSVAVILLQKGAARARQGRAKRVDSAGVSPTLDLTLLLVVRALDSVVQSLILRKTQPLSTTDPKRSTTTRNGVEPLLVQEKLQREEAKRVNEERQRMTVRVDALLFWLCSSRIMWCFFYAPHRLPRSYLKWISRLAYLDERIPEALRLIRNKRWSYINGTAQNPALLHEYVRDLGYPASWGDLNDLPAYGGAIANAAWKKLGIPNRSGVGGLPCEVVHGPIGKSLGLQSSCHANAGLRGIRAFGQALFIYVPVHFIPVLLTRPRTLLRPARLAATTAGAFRSTAFLASFLSLYWYAVCLSRTLVLARLLPFVSHDFWDGPYGCILAGSLACGSSIWIENGKRRGEMALYVLPRAFRTFLPGWTIRSQSWKGRLAERIAFVLSMSTLLTAAIHRPDSLRGLSRWALAFVINGPSAGFWKRKRRDPSIPPTPSAVPTPFPQKDIQLIDQKKDNDEQYPRK
ncbi:hypothetical protein EST38_g2910 [Candolleomyces aberdarensis]|uniref:Transmembrane protein 135 N-terminal domain-containing protein n=1 Tax=Candolleomyces aberdarensis TaxID=2316362 RepID=A0A4Q2DRU2_9AGAR|nr:hypothetical protein EST38_g2910 [Candolleomyces aberdarensis]